MEQNGYSQFVQLQYQHKYEEWATNTRLDVSQFEQSSSSSFLVLLVLRYVRWFAFELDITVCRELGAIATKDRNGINTHEHTYTHTQIRAYTEYGSAGSKLELCMYI